VAASRRLAVFILAILAMVLPCCNSRMSRYPPLGQVTGVVSCGGQPLSNITVLFQPVAGGRASIGITDAEGRYSLRYTEVADGAMVGDHTVSLSEPLDESDPRATLRKVRKGLAKQFSFAVRKGKQTFDIDVPTDGYGRFRAAGGIEGDTLVRYRRSDHGH
jgi:hypothetical protein